MTAQEMSWASAEDAKGPDQPGPIATEYDAVTQDTTFDRECIRRRRDASLRLPPLHCGHRDPLECLTDEVPAIVGPARFGLTPDEARRHGNELIAQGWSVEEVAQVLGIKPRPGMAA